MFWQLLASNFAVIERDRPEYSGSNGVGNLTLVGVSEGAPAR
jgi:hypothetical protein